MLSAITVPIEAPTAPNFLIIIELTIKLVIAPHVTDIVNSFCLL